MKEIISQAQKNQNNARKSLPHNHYHVIPLDMTFFTVTLANITLYKLPVLLHNACAAKMASLIATVIWNHRIWELIETWRSLGPSPSSARWENWKEMLSERVTSPRASLLDKSPSVTVHLGQKTRSSTTPPQRYLFFYSENSSSETFWSSDPFRLYNYWGLQKDFVDMSYSNQRLPQQKQKLRNF